MYPLRNRWNHVVVANESILDQGITHTNGASHEEKKHRKRWTPLRGRSFGQYVHDARERWYRCSSSTRVIATVAFIILTSYVTVRSLDWSFRSYGFEASSSRQKGKGSPSRSFAVVVNTYKRPERLQKAIRHYADACGRRSGVSQVFVVWGEIGNEPPRPESFFPPMEESTTLRRKADGGGVVRKNRAEVVILRMEQDSLNTRFLPIDNLKGDAIFTVDDDVRVSCSSLLRGFQAWRSSPDSMVGYYPRLASEPLGASLGDKRKGQLVYHTWPIVFWRRQFNFVLTKASFLHSKYLGLYFSKSHPKEVRDYVNDNKNCEDVAMAFLVANQTRASPDGPSHPIYVQGDVSDTGLFSGISTSVGHFATRSVCLTDLTRIYEKHGWEYPLSDVSLQSRSWVRHYPGFWWQWIPSNHFEWYSFPNMFS